MQRNSILLIASLAIALGACSPPKAQYRAGVQDGFNQKTPAEDTQSPADPAAQTPPVIGEPIAPVAAPAPSEVAENPVVKTDPVVEEEEETSDVIPAEEKKPDRPFERVIIPRPEDPNVVPEAPSLTPETPVVSPSEPVAPAEPATEKEESKVVWNPNFGKLPLPDFKVEPLKPAATPLPQFKFEKIDLTPKAPKLVFPVGSTEPSKEEEAKPEETAPQAPVEAPKKTELVWNPSFGKIPTPNFNVEPLKPAATPAPGFKFDPVDLTPKRPKSVFPAGSTEAPKEENTKPEEVAPQVPAETPKKSEIVWNPNFGKLPLPDFKVEPLTPTPSLPEVSPKKGEGSVRPPQPPVTNVTNNYYVNQVDQSVRTHERTTVVAPTTEVQVDSSQTTTVVKKEKPPKPRPQARPPVGKKPERKQVVPRPVTPKKEETKGVDTAVVATGSSSEQKGKTQEDLCAELDESGINSFYLDLNYRTWLWDDVKEAEVGVGLNQRNSDRVGFEYLQTPARGLLEKKSKRATDFGFTNPETGSKANLKCEDLQCSSGKSFGELWIAGDQRRSLHVRNTPFMFEAVANLPKEKGKGHPYYDLLSKTDNLFFVSSTAIDGCYEDREFFSIVIRRPGGSYPLMALTGNATARVQTLRFARQAEELRGIQSVQMNRLAGGRILLTFKTNDRSHGFFSVFIKPIKIRK